ncbi:MAG: hypothetical protein CMH56_10930 [Myxococcales bacterium]|nr:hypothetical protein [Myxococcales bacterium]|tara:strand:- start:3270 stop:4655 length:1386 start_codon:yes stop_codon:yes gene_type:complete
MTQLSGATVAVAGASGFIGQALGPLLGNQNHLIGLSRSAKPAQNGYSEFRRADLFSMKDAESALENVDYAIYLVHSMMPSARLVQGAFEDLDLLCADNFAKAAARNGVKQIVYLGGLMPNDDDVSAHLQSRLEVEEVLGSEGVPVTSLRAGLVIGANGSSYQLLTRLVQRLPVMVLPSWTQTKMQPVSEQEVVQAFQYVLGNPDSFGAVYDLYSTAPVSYEQLMQATAQALELKRRFVGVPLLSPRLSRLWVSLTTGAPKELVAPLIESLRHEMLARKEAPHQLPMAQEQDLIELIQQASQRGQASKPPRAFLKPSNSRGADTVRSVQRMRLPAGKDAQWAANEYFRWLPEAMKGLVQVIQLDENKIGFRFSDKGPLLLELEMRSHRSDPQRQVMRVTGGYLAKETERGRLEFRQVLNGRTLLAAIHDFEPRLPWWIYRSTQAEVHRWIMDRFGKHLDSFS